jgi:anaerobic selenocysteine-containing dehydrogenase
MAKTPQGERVSPPPSWGKSTIDTACPLDCPDNCSLSVTVERGRVSSIDGSRRAPTTDGYICGKVRGFDKRVYHANRILHPMVRTGPRGGGQFARIPWDEALDLIVAKMTEARDCYGAESVLPYYYGGSNGLLTNELEDARFFRRFGASRLHRTLCAAATGAAATALYGKMAGVAYDDYVYARLIVVWGANPSASGIHLVSHIKQAQKDGARLVVIDPRRTPLARIADLHLPVRPGSDLPVALAVINDLFERGWTDDAFLREHADGVDALRQAASQWSIERAADEAGLAADDLRTFAQWYGTTSPAVIRCGWGQERNRNGEASSAAIMALPAVGGKFGVRGGGYTMSNSGAWGINAEALIGTPAPPARLINMNQLGRVLTEPLDPPVTVLFVYNCNPLATVPDQNRVRQGLMRDDLFTVVHEQVMTDTAEVADLVLPATTFLEHYDIAKGYGAYHFELVQPVIAPVGESRSNHELFRALGVRFGISDEDELGEPGALLEAAGRLPKVLGDALLSGQRAVPLGGTNPIQFIDVRPATSDGRIHLYPNALATAEGGPYAYRPDPRSVNYPLSLITPASEHTISSTLGELRPGIVKIKIHPEDAHARNIAEGDSVRVFNELGEVHCDASIGPDVRPGIVSLPKGLWAKNTYNGRTANALAPATLAPTSGGACFNDARVQVELLGRH